MSRQASKRDRGSICRPWLSVWLIFLFFLSPGLSPVYSADTTPSQSSGASGEPSSIEKRVDESGSATTAVKEKASDEYGDVTEEEASAGEGPQIADPLEPWNRAMYHFNDKLYFWVLKPAAEGYKYVLPEEVRGLFTNFYRNIKAPIRIVNNLLQGKPGYAGLELARFLINSTVGVGGLRDCAKECFGVTGRDADFGQTLGKYGVGFGFYLVWPFIGPSSPRDTVGWVADWALKPTTYITTSNDSQLISPLTAGLYAHEAVNTTSFRIGDYEILKKAAVDPYVAIRDAYIQYRKKAIDQ